jgi:hypothetical protein
MELRQKSLLGKLRGSLGRLALERGGLATERKAWLQTSSVAPNAGLIARIPYALPSRSSTCGSPRKQRHPLEGVVNTTNEMLVDSN